MVARKLIDTYNAVYYSFFISRYSDIVFTISEAKLHDIAYTL